MEKKQSLEAEEGVHRIVVTHNSSQIIRPSAFERSGNEVPNANTCLRERTSESAADVDCLAPCEKLEKTIDFFSSSSSSFYSKSDDKNWLPMDEIKIHFAPADSFEMR